MNAGKPHSSADDPSNVGETGMRSYCAAGPELLEDPGDFVSPEDDCFLASFLARMLSLVGVALKSSLDASGGVMLVLPVPLPAAPDSPAPLLLRASGEPNPLEPAVSDPEETLDCAPAVPAINTINSVPKNMFAADFIVTPDEMGKKIFLTTPID